MRPPCSAAQGCGKLTWQPRRWRTARSTRNSASYCGGCRAAGVVSSFAALVTGRLPLHTLCKLLEGVPRLEVLQRLAPGCSCSEELSVKVAELRAPTGAVA